jgi:transposase-like protein
MTILRQVPSEAKIRRVFKKILFGKYLSCPHCGSRVIKKYEGRYRCKKCRRPFSLTSSSWLKGMKLSLEIFYALLWCWINKTPVDQAVRLTQVSLPTVRNWYEKFRDNLPNEMLEQMRLSGIIQEDEAYRGSKNAKFSIIGAKEAKSVEKKLKMVVLFKKSVARNDIVNFCKDNIVPGSLLCTDGAAIYKGIGNWWPLEHQYEIHKKFEFAITSEIEGVWGVFFTFIRRMYHHVTINKIESIVKEFNFRFCFEETFKNPENYLTIALKANKVPIVCKNSGKISLTKKTILNLNLAQNNTISVPS